MHATDSNVTADAANAAGEPVTLTLESPKPRPRARIAAAALGMAAAIVFFFCAVPPAHSGSTPPAALSGPRLILDTLRLLTRVAATEPSTDGATDAGRALPSGGIRN
jgi:hypothetical protein